MDIEGIVTLPSTSLARTLLSDVQVRNTYPLSSFRRTWTLITSPTAPAGFASVVTQRTL
jgi:hypothetical protein